MRSEVAFDRHEYRPGDTVRATVRCFGPFPGKLRGITASIEIGEYTETTHTETDGDGDIYTETEYETFFHVYEEAIIDSTSNYHELVLEAMIPYIYLPPVEIDNSYTFHRVHIKFDKKLAVDDHDYVPIPIHYTSPKEEPEPISHVVRCFRYLSSPIFWSPTNRCLLMSN